MYISLKRFETQKRYEFHTDNINKCLGIFIEKGIDLSGLTVRSQNLEDLFLKLTGRQLRN
jgi:ABC-2 type transport system ATP-binding protein